MSDQSEKERTLVLRVEIDNYGRPEHLESLAQAIAHDLAYKCTTGKEEERVRVWIVDEETETERRVLFDRFVDDSGHHPTHTAWWQRKESPNGRNGLGTAGSK